jgi:adenylate cyclase, class 2
MDPDYFEKETKILDVDVESVSQKMSDMGAVMVFDGERLITYLDSKDGSIRSSGRVLKITDEGTTKVSLSTPVDNDENEQIKFKVSRRKEAQDFLSRLGFSAIAEVRQRRISFELDGIDVDIDLFPEIPPFAEVDMADNPLPLEDFLKQLGIATNERVVMSTPEVFNKYGKDFFELFKVNG